MSNRTLVQKKLHSLLANKDYQDPGDRMTFNGPPEGLEIPSFDRRSDNQLLEVAFNHESSIERERAIWEYAYRQDENDALKKIGEILKSEQDADTRSNLQWLAIKINSEKAIPLLKDCLQDEDSEVRDWARVNLNELTGEDFGMEYDSVVYNDQYTFDQTVPLIIGGYADVLVPGQGWIQAKLSPQWFASLLGRVLACTNTDTFLTNLVIEKEIKNYNTDGSNHYEPFMFRGMSYEANKYLYKHVYQSNTTRPLYTKGKVKEKEDNPYLINVELQRTAFTELMYPDEENISFSSINGTMTKRGEKLKKRGFVRSVRGKFSGWAYTDLNRFMKTGEVKPGTVQLTNTTDAVNGHLANTIVYGTFRGKSGDFNHEGRINLNSIPCHATEDGLLDLDLDGVADKDPFVPSVDYR
ncbi:HEAT repeat protein [Scopulibacillus darangshiensis]|uniref:HEAT repeat protein n=1 Tax=Scopulibacillus darangshiensis TaxID=442528 RepID=A0A4R2NSQ6_9BACL|nr:HEAT repeat domain-containing protein [Scopulibacillus darangshiensis]TCP24468.1 HEAT repeat protein [Scopulibacillus darangshiensis]